MADTSSGGISGGLIGMVIFSGKRPPNQRGNDMRILTVPVAGSEH